MPRFALKDLLIASALVAAGMAMLCVLFEHDRGSELKPLMIGLWPGGWALVCAGLFLPFRRAWIGACIGAAASVVLLWAGLWLETVM